jgi:hypothetical protein
MEELLQLRGNPIVFKMVMCDCLLPSVVGKQEWKKSCHVKRPDQLAISITQEAWALLCVENSIDKWNAMQLVENSGESAVILPEAKYTLNKNMAKKNHGWKIQGLQRFSELCKMVREDRDKHGSSVDNEYMVMKDTELYAKKRNNRKRAELGSPLVEEVVYDDMAMLFDQQFGSSSSSSEQGEEHSSSGSSAVAAVAEQTGGAEQLLVSV